MLVEGYIDGNDPVPVDISFGVYEDTTKEVVLHIKDARAGSDDPPTVSVYFEAVTLGELVGEARLAAKEAATHG